MVFLNIVDLADDKAIFRISAIDFCSTSQIFTSFAESGESSSQAYLTVKEPYVTTALQVSA